MKTLAHFDNINHNILNEVSRPCDITTETGYRNITGYDVTFLNRNNIAITVPSESIVIGTVKKIIIEKVIKIKGRENIGQYLANLWSMKNNSSLDQASAAILDRLSKIVSTQSLPTAITIGVNFELNPAHLETDDLYLKVEDVLIYRGGLNINKKHPNSEVVNRYDHIHAALGNKLVSGAFIDIIDNESEVNKKHIWLGNRIVEVAPRVDTTMASGVYYSTVNASSFKTIHLKNEYFTFKEAEEKLGLYSTVESAMLHGNPEMIRKEAGKNADKELELLKIRNNRTAQETVSLKMEADQSKHESEKAKHKADMAKHEADEAKAKLSVMVAERQAELDAIKSDNDLEVARLKREMEKEVEELKRKGREQLAAYEEQKLKREGRQDEKKVKREEKKETRKDHYEERSYSRKDNSEMLKFLPVVAIAALGILAWWAKK